ncbi:MAG: OmpA family protein [Lachnospiraceae bacterium]|nr:OmpA family protein [Lachnospiraceae bacterium]
MRRKYDVEYGEENAYSPWETYSDLYCGLLLVFVLLFFFAIYQYIDARETNDADTAALQESMLEEQASVLAIYKADLEEQEAAYQEKNDELASQQSVLAILQADLEEQESLIASQQAELEEKESEMDAQASLLAVQQSALEEQEAALSVQQATLSEQETQLSAQQATLEEQETQLLTQQATLKEQEAALAEQQTTLAVQEEELAAQQTTVESLQAQLDEQAAQIEQIIGVRSQLIELLNEELTAHGIAVQADLSTGAIVFESSILFDKNSMELSEEGKEFFREFLPVYLEVLLQPEFLDYIAEILIEGHTDDSGTYLYNLQLSQQRAYSVSEYFLGDDCDFLDAETIEVLKTLVTVNGCADKDPICLEDGTIDEEASRRVEIKFRLKDQEMIEELDEILN